MPSEIKCKKCGHNEFKKASVQSCSAIPPLFKCVKCNTYQNIPRSYNRDVLDFLPINDKEDHFMGHLKCNECSEISQLTYELDMLPNGWRVITKYIYDVENNPMVRHYAYCPRHRIS